MRRVQWKGSKNTILFDPNVIQHFLWTESASECSEWKVKILWFLILRLFNIFYEQKVQVSAVKRLLTGVKKKSKNTLVFDPNVIQHFLWTESASECSECSEWKVKILWFLILRLFNIFYEQKVQVSAVKRLLTGVKKKSKNTLVFDPKVFQDFLRIESAIWLTTWGRT